jgi:nicotinamide-nucleotide amidase
MQAEILSVGTELLLGQIVNSNAAYLARRLSDIGIDLFRETTVGDNPERIGVAVSEAAGRADVVLITGGLGPTADDITSEAVARALGLKLVLDHASAEHIRSLLQRRGIPVLESHMKQALVPAGARIMPNPVGTAPGFIVDWQGRAICAMPGVPAEMEAMAEQTLWPELRRRCPTGVIRSRVLRFVGLGESSLEDLVKDLVAAQTNPTIAFLAKAGEAHLRLTAKSADAAEADGLLDSLEAAVRARAGQYLYGRDEETLEAAVGARLHAAGLTVGVAESCTGGLIGHRITQIPGSSDYFLGSLVTYSNQAKVAVLGVPEKVLAEHGAVSPPVAIAMAAGARRALGAAIAVSVTGIAGPGGGTPEKPVGLTYIGFSGPKGEECEEHRLGGTRDMIKMRAANAALSLLLRQVERLAGGARRRVGKPSANARLHSRQSGR